MWKNKPFLRPEDMQNQEVEPFSLVMKRSLFNLLCLVVSLIVAGAWFGIIFSIGVFLDAKAGQGAGVHSLWPFIGLLVGFVTGGYIFYKIFMWLISRFESLISGDNSGVSLSKKPRIGNTSSDVDGELRQTNRND